VRLRRGLAGIIAGTPDAVPMGQGPLPPGGGVPGAPPQPPTTPGASRGNQPPSTYTGIGGQPTPPGSQGGGGAPTPTPAPFSTGIFGDKPKTVGPIVGVKIAMHKRALRKWREREFYDEWRFIAGDADNDLFQGPVRKLPPGMPPVNPEGR
jgi:hypothetical protein